MKINSNYKLRSVAGETIMVDQVHKIFDERIVNEVNPKLTHLSL